MPKTTNRPAQKRAAPQASAAPEAAAEAREPRGARRKRETRARLLDAALKLMAEKGMEGVAINEITEAADVGFGSFYNHFESKEAIYATLVESVFEEFADWLDRLTLGLSDPAEVIAVSVRYTLMRAHREPLWGQFLVREGFSSRMLDRGLGKRLLRDVQRGIVAKRFAVADPFVAFLSVGGTVLASVTAQLGLASPDAPNADALTELGFSGEHLAERVAAALLQSLGLKRAEAEKVAARPLPLVEPAVEAD
ncbi:TetR/AcrR family transcriptional regulator [Paraburkholderia phenoliruptrix]|uniref:TetR/AcrR family transcriptional regulator n=1 Tax=Paraburkholderia phenoliruptrix TaxID=252970 RepID=UPI0028698BF3|nr:TetR/AcrR family transcriptional regulator [Paraburkholderia phenoliruptrix]WMY10196.1 TetR/AcrR family transcriptional regulator [Paraburkholderia phenoliruptrix]